MDRDASTLFKKAFTATLPVMAGYLVLGAGFGILMSNAGIGMLYTMLMSIFVYAGSMQYLAVNLITAGTPLVTLAVTTFMVNARHLFYGISMIEPYKNTGLIKPYLIFALTDETYSLVSSPLPLDRTSLKKYYLYVSLLDHFYWIMGTLFGVLFASVYTFNTKGIDFALTALFLSIFTEQWLTNRSHFPASAGVLASLVCLLIFGKNNFLIPAMVCITLLLLLYRKFKKTKGDGNHE